MSPLRRRRLEAMRNVSRTPEDAFAALPDFDFVPQYREADGLRLAHIDEGHGRPVLFVHGEPTWSFLYRRVIPPIRDAGYRCVAPDLAGFGRSDKPLDIGWYSYDRHVGLTASLLEHLDLLGVTIVVHDQGGPVGLRLAVEHPTRIDRLVILNTGLATGHERRPGAWYAFRDFVAENEDLPVGSIVRAGCKNDPGEDVIAAYDAPYQDAQSKAGTRSFPRLIPLTPDDRGADTNRRVLAALHDDRRPTLMLWADSDSVYPIAAGERFAEAIGQPAPEVIRDAGHFLQEDRGPELGQMIAAWLGDRDRRVTSS